MAAPGIRPCLPGLLLALLLPCFCYLLLPRAAAKSSQPAPADEAQLLLQIKRAWGDPPVLAGWNASASASHCAWPFVGCDTAGRVTNLTLADANVSGPFPDAVGGLTHLTYLDVSDNSITDMFPTALYRCASLRYIDLSQNYFGGELPVDIGHRLPASLNTLVLSGNEFNGTIPRSLSSLLNLRHLKLDSNRLVGTVPAELGALTRLQTLWLAYNPFAPGELPASFKNLTNLVSLLAANCNLVGDFLRYLAGMQGLEELDLSNNNFNGSIPRSLSSLLNLRHLKLDNNRLVGTVPAGLGALTRLQTLWLASNPFAPGKLPASFKNLTNLVNLWATNCSLVGDLPSYLANMQEMEVLNLSENSLTGSIPPGVWGLRKLQKMIVYSNNLTGNMVVDDGFAAKNLTAIDVSENNLSGVIPEIFGHLQSLTILQLFSNNFSGEIPASIGRLPSLQILRLRNNRFTGTLPLEVGKHSSLGYVEVDDNELTGAIPEGLCAGGQFHYFTADQNHLNGSIPASLANCTTLVTLDLGNNQLTGDVPVALWTAMQLHFLTLQSNQLTGSLPASMSGQLKTLHIGNNQIGGKIPAAAVMLRLFTAENNQFSGEIPPSLGDGMPLLQALNLSGNQLSGAIPKRVASLRQLTFMDMSRNRLSGAIPAELGAMPVLSVLDLSSNELSGAIPPELVQPNLNTLNLSSNNLSGQVPTGFATAVYDNSFRDNPGLCTAAPGPGYLDGVRSCAAAGSQDRATSRGVSHALRTGLLVAVGALLAAAAFALLVVRDIKKRPRVAVRDEWKITPFVQDLGFAEASTILRELIEDNLIGRGGSGHVYLVTYTNRLNGSAGTVAVKQIRIAGTLDEKLEREFESEAGILGNVRHNNIVRLQCYLSGSDAKLLVYDYMDNGSLDQWLHGHNACADGILTAMAPSTRRAPLDWLARLRVAVGVAQGLCYLHHECSPPIIHRDVKTSNILLDSELRAKVADFGLARMLVEIGAPKTMSAVAGSFGYMAPECAYTNKVNEKVDVYSFGVVLLELTTGKDANAGGEHGCLAEWARHHYQSGGSIPDATDRSIRYAGYSEEIQIVFRLGVLCTADMPSSRPAMKDVLQILLKCSEQTRQKSKMENSQQYEAAPLLLPQRRSRRKQPSNGAGIDIEENSDLDSRV